MSSSIFPPTDFGDSDMMNYAVRMVIPLRREFGRALDIPHFMHDLAYAKEIIDQAKVSKDARLRDYAAYFETRLLGPRDTSRAPAPPPGAPTAAVAEKAAEPAAAPDSQSAELSESELRARMLSKYKSGLR